MTVRSTSSICKHRQRADGITTGSPAFGTPMLVAMRKGDLKKARLRWSQHRQNSRNRRIGFKFDFPTWIGMWVASGVWPERGRHRGQFVMARRGDRGDYEPANILFITNGENVGGPSIGKPRPDAVRAKISAKKKGVPSMHRGFRHTAASRRRMRAGCAQRHDTGWVEHVREAAKAAWARRRAEALP
jgi:hypothetical protein